MARTPPLRPLIITAGLVGGSILAGVAVRSTGVPVATVAVGGLCVLSLVLLSSRSGGQFRFDAEAGQEIGPDSHSQIWQAARDVCDRAGRPLPRLLALEMDAPGAMVGYDSGEPVVALDPLLIQLIGVDGVRALLAHELGHLGIDLYTDAIRLYTPRIIGFGVFWSLLLAGRGRVVASLGTGLFILLASSERQSVRWLRYLLSFGVEPVALAASRHADRLEELQADRYAAQIVDPETLTEALYRVAAVATGDNMEDVAGPIPWDADRSLRFGLFATHPSIETRAAHLDCTIPAWARPYRPHRSEQAPA